MGAFCSLFALSNAMKRSSTELSKNMCDSSEDQEQQNNLICTTIMTTTIANIVTTTNSALKTITYAPCTVIQTQTLTTTVCSMSFPLGPVSSVYENSDNKESNTYSDLLNAISTNDAVFAQRKCIRKLEAKVLNCMPVTSVDQPELVNELIDLLCQINESEAKQADAYHKIACATEKVNAEKKRVRQQLLAYYATFPSNNCADCSKNCKTCNLSTEMTFAYQALSNLIVAENKAILKMSQLKLFYDESNNALVKSMESTFKYLQNIAGQLN